MCAGFCTKLHLKNVDTWKITTNILWPYSGSSFAANKTICCYNYGQQNLSELNWSIHELIGLLIALAPLLPGVEGPAVLFLLIENSLYQQNITLSTRIFFNGQNFSF